VCTALMALVIMASAYVLLVHIQLANTLHCWNWFSGSLGRRALVLRFLCLLCFRISMWLC